METTEDRRLKIGELARQTDLSIKTIRYDEQRGLLEQPPRTEGGYRLYGPEEVARLRFIQRAKLLGLTLEEIRELVGLAARCRTVILCRAWRKCWEPSWKRLRGRWPS